MDGTLKVDLAYFYSDVENRRLSRSVLGVVLAAHAGLLLALATNRREISLPVEQPIIVSLIAEAAPKADVAPKPLPMQQKPVELRIKPKKNPIKPQAVAAPQDPEPQLVSKAAEDVSVSVPEHKSAPSAAESPAQPPQQRPETARMAEAAPKEEPIEQPSFNADYLDNPAPAYPGLSRKLREQGQVLLRVNVDAAGHPEQVTLHVSSGYARLDERAVETVWRWKFVPARQGSQPVAAWVIVPIQFSLKG